MKPCCVIFGFGYTAQALAPKLLAQGFEVIGTQRNVHARKPSNDIKLLAFDDPNLIEPINRATHLLISVPPSFTKGDRVWIEYGDLIKNKSKNLAWLGYLSSTGVYGDHQGKWVDEDTTCRPHTPTAMARLQAEQTWLDCAKSYQLPLHIFRLSGIYGPGRNALERMIQGKAYSLFKADQVFCRIHVEDIVSILLASMRTIQPWSIYNVSDDEPAASHTVDHYAALLLNRTPLPLLPISEAQLSPMEQEFYANNRRVSNLKIKQALDISLKYPSFREGLSQIKVLMF